MKQNIYFYKKKREAWNLKEVAQVIHVTPEPGWEKIEIKDIKPLMSADTEDISFLTNSKYQKDFDSTKAVACVVNLDFISNINTKSFLLKTENPYHAYAILLEAFYEPIKKQEPKIETSAIIGKNVIIGANCYISHNVVIEDNVTIGDNSCLAAGVFIGYNVAIGNRARIDHNVSITNSIIGDDFVALAGARIGQDGFGFSTSNAVHKKIIHTGRVLIGNDVEIGANSTIDRGSAGDTIIEDGCRIDNLVQIGHNVRIGQGSIIVSQTGIAGSSKIGKYCALGGQVGVSGHITIVDHVQVSGQGGVIQNITQAGIFGGTPAVPIKDWHRQSIFLKKIARKNDK